MRPWLIVAPLLAPGCGNIGTKPPDADAEETSAAKETGDTAETDAESLPAETSGETTQESDTAPDTESAAESDTQVVVETGVAQAFLYGYFATSDGLVDAGQVGLEYYRRGQLPTLESVCSIVGDVAISDIRPPRCTTCDWFLYFDVDASQVNGADCAELGVYDGAVDAWSMGIGWADSFVYGSGTVDAAVFYFSATYNSWALIGYDAPGVGYNQGNAYEATFNLPTPYTYAFTL